MLLQLDIQNIALIDKLSLEISPGFNVLTGETGAGKSILIDSINAVLGERVTKDIIRSGKDKALVEAVFEYNSTYIDNILEQLGIECSDGQVILSRDISLTGKNTCRINGRLVNVSVLKQIGELLIDIHGQHDNQSLLKTETHIDLLDAFGGIHIEKIKSEYINLFGQYKTIKSRLQELMGDKGEIARRMDMLKFQIDEIRNAKLKKEEDQVLDKKRQILSNSEKIINSIINSYDLLNEGTTNSKSVIYNSNKALQDLIGIQKYDEDITSITEKLESVIYQLEDICEDLRTKRDAAEFNPDELAHIDERLDIISRLKRKYGASVEEILKFLSNSEIEYERLTQCEALAENLNKQLIDIRVSLFDYAKKLHLERQKEAMILETKITSELENLEMKNASFKVNIHFDEVNKHFSKNGLNTIEFLISSNAGEPLKPLSKIVSGGEMSRIMLAIKTILADVDSIPTLIFDEIDTGISGKAAQKVGEKLSFISESHQVLCVTHLSQLASMADNHFLIKKCTNGENTYTTVEILDKEGRIQEIARIIGGSELTDIALKHSAELIHSAEIFKQKN